MLNKIESIKSIVHQILKNHPETRDNDRLLMLKVWAIQNPRLRDERFNFISFSHGFIKADYADPESIRRARQKIQENHIEMRGLYYHNRKELSTKTRCGINQMG
jgi:hypothetical protein